MPPSSLAAHSVPHRTEPGSAQAGGKASPQEQWLLHSLALAHSDPPSPLCPPPLSSSIWLLLKNPTFVLLCLAGATEATLITGMSTFGPKFLESQFSLSASEAATLFGEKGPQILGVLSFLRSSQMSKGSLTVHSRKPRQPSPRGAPPRQGSPERAPRACQPGEVAQGPTDQPYLPEQTLLLLPEVWAQGPQHVWCAEGLWCCAAP